MKVALPFSKLEVERGDLVFEKDAPFSPRINLAADTRMRGYSLDIEVFGNMPNQKVVVRADPPLPQEDALLLLSVGTTRDGLSEEGLSRAAATRVASLLSDSILGEILGPTDPDAERSIADRFRLEVGRDVSRSGASTIEAEFELLDWLFMRAERDRYDDYNLGLLWRLKFK